MLMLLVPNFRIELLDIGKEIVIILAATSGFRTIVPSGSRPFLETL